MLYVNWEKADFIKPCVQECSIFFKLKTTSEEREFSSFQSFNRVQFCNSMDYSTPGFPVHHQLLERAQIHVHWVSDAIQPSHPLSSPSPPSFSLPASGFFQMSQFFASGGVSALASVLPMNIQDWFPWGLTGFIALQSKGLSRVISNTTVQKYQFFGAQLFYSSTLTSICDYWKNLTVD